MAGWCRAVKVLLNHSKAKALHQSYPDLIGVLFSPERTRFYDGIPFAIDNGAYGAWQRKEQWDESLFRSVVEKFAGRLPLFVVCPDVIGEKEKTLAAWERWHPWLKSLGVPVAFVFTDEMTVGDIPRDADYVFIGGSTLFKEWAITQVPSIPFPVHVGRVNHHSRLWKSKNYGAVSCDGTGWFRGDKKQEQVLYDYLNICSGKMPTEQNSLFHIGAYCR
jgi:hypothetical protein